MNQTQRIEITTISILKVFGVMLAIFFLWKILNILGLLFVVAIVVAALDPAVAGLQRSGLPRGVAVSLIYLGLFFILAFIFSLLLPPLVDQLSALTVTFPTLIARVTPLYQVIVDSNAQDLLSTISAELSAFTQGIFAATARLFGGAAAFISVLVLSFYILLDVGQARLSFIPLIPAGKVKPVVATLEKVSATLGSWLRGQLFLSVIITLVTYVGLLMLGVPYALTLAVLAGVLEIIPYLGPILAGIVALVVAYASGSWQLAAGVLIFYAALQQLENHFLVPKIMQSAVGLSPVTIIIALAIGGQLAGITGAIIAVPLTAVLTILAAEWPKLQKA